MDARQAAAVVVPGYINTDDQVFPRPNIVRRQVRFWDRIFYKYPSTTVIVHDTDEPDRIVDVIDYKVLRPKNARELPVPRKERDEVTQRYLKRYMLAVDRFAREGDGALRYGAIEKRLYHVFHASPAALKRLYSGDVRLRAQTGLADDFLGAATVAQAYLPYMEKVFHKYGAPTRLTRLAFVESMFNLKARSKVGASGIWQFMPATARNYIHVTRLVDERNSPYKETRAAAQFLLGNYRELGTWPLAITAYNHGLRGMGKATKQLGTRDIAKVIQSYQSPSFGFASRNFYAEFLAAADTYDRLQRLGRIGPKSDQTQTETVILKHPISVAHLLRHTPLTKEVLARYNPCLLETAFTTLVNKPLPAFYEIRVPRALARKTRMALLEPKDTRYAKK